MLSAIHDAVRTLLYERGFIDALDVDVTFETPAAGWVSSLVRPTVNFFLFEVFENTEKRDGAPLTSVTGGRAERRLPPRRIDLTYLVSAMTGDVVDEHDLLWRVLATLLRHRQFPIEVVPEALRTVAPAPVARIATRDEARGLLELWNALGVPPHPALAYVVTAPVDLAVAVESPLVLTRTARYRGVGHAHGWPAEPAAGGGTPANTDGQLLIGGTVTDRTGAPVAGATLVPEGHGRGATTAADGRYALHVSAGVLTLLVGWGSRRPRRVEVQVPGASYDIVLDGS